MKREAAGLSPSQCAISNELLRAFFQNRTAQDVPGSGRIINLCSDTFFQLGLFIEWLTPQREHFREQSRILDAVMREKILLLRDKDKRKPGWLDQALPQPTFHQGKATAFAYGSLLRDLIQNRALQIRKGDGLDFTHAVIATAFATFATLDSQWKVRVESLPKPNKIPRIYGDSQLEAMIRDIEAAQAQLKHAASASS